MKNLSTIFIVIFLLVISTFSCHRYEGEITLPVYYDDIIYHPKEELHVYVDSDVTSSPNVLEAQEIYSSVTGLGLVNTKDIATADVVLDKTELDTLSKMLRNREYVKLSKHVESNLYK
jgi:hypothetical protein